MHRGRGTGLRLSSNGFIDYRRINPVSVRILGKPWCLFNPRLSYERHTANCPDCEPFTFNPCRAGKVFDPPPLRLTRLLGHVATSGK